MMFRARSSTATRVGILAALVAASGCADVAAPPNQLESKTGNSARQAVGALETFYGPERFTRGRGRPDEVVRQISTQQFEAPFLLHVRSGDAAGNHRVSSASVTLDGVEVLGKNAFNQRDHEWTVEVTPQRLTTLGVSLSSAPESFLDIWIEGKRSATLFCPDGRPGSVTNIAQAIAQTPAGGTVAICDGTHVVQNVDIRKSLTFEAAGPGMPTLDANGAFSVFRSFNQPVDIVVRGLRFRGASEHTIHYNSSRSLRVEGSEFHPFQTHAYQVPTAGYTENWMSGIGAFGNIGNVTVDGSTFIGGDIGIHANVGCCTMDGQPGSGSLRVTNSHFTGQSNAGVFTGGSTPGYSLHVELNTFDACGRFGCTKLFSSTGGSARYVANTFNVRADHPVFTPINVGLFPGGGTAVIERNQIIGTGGSGDRMAQSSYPIDGFAIQVAADAATINGNTITNTWVAVNVSPAAMTGRDNTISHVSTVLFGGGMPASASVVFQRNDITDYMQMLLNSPIFASVDLRCNWWGSAGPSVTGPGTTPSMYTPFANAEIANTSTSCSP